VIGLARRVAMLPVVVLACALPNGSAQAAGTESVATAVGERDESQAFDLAWEVSKQRGDGVVDQLNAAKARARYVPEQRPLQAADLG